MISVLLSLADVGFDLIPTERLLYVFHFVIWRDGGEGSKVKRRRVKAVDAALVCSVYVNVLYELCSAVFVHSGMSSVVINRELNSFRSSSVSSMRLSRLNAAYHSGSSRPRRRYVCENIRKCFPEYSPSSLVFVFESFKWWR